MSKRKLNEKDVPEPIGQDNVASRTAVSKPTFSHLELDARLLKAVTQEKFATPTPVQAKAIPLILKGDDVLARAKTGSGKTIAYLLPILHHILLRKRSSKNANFTSTLLLVPTKELASQVAVTLKSFTQFCGSDIKGENITRKEDSTVTRARLMSQPDVVIATPGQATKWVNEGVLSLRHLKHLVVDEADLVLSYGYQEDIENIASALPAGFQAVLMSATLRTEVDTLTSLLLNRNGTDSSESQRKPTVLDLSAYEAADVPKLSQYVVRCAEDEKFLLIYTIFKLQLIKGKVIVFVADVDRCYRLKLFLEQFGVRSCVLNSELPVNSRSHVVQEFNKGVYDILIAADDKEVIGNEDGRRKKRKVGQEEQQQDDEVDDITTGGVEIIKQSEAKKSKREDKEYGISRGLDFRNVSCVLNFDLPTTSKSYIHRIGRTARAGQAGMALSFIIPKEKYRQHKPTSIPQCENDEKVLAKIEKRQVESGSKIEEWQFDMNKLEGFRYRLADALRSVTRIAVREARAKELRNELINSAKLKQHFEENPDELRHLRRHDEETHAVKMQPHLRHVPDYLLPSGGKAAVTKEAGFVSMRKDRENRIRKARALNKSRSRGRLAKTKNLDPLKSLNVRGRGKK